MHSNRKLDALTVFGLGFIEIEIIVYAQHNMLVFIVEWSSDCVASASNHVKNVIEFVKMGFLESETCLILVHLNQSCM